MNDSRASQRNAPRIDARTGPQPRPSRKRGVRPDQTTKLTSLSGTTIARGSSPFRCACTFSRGLRGRDQLRLGQPGRHLRCRSRTLPFTWRTSSIVSRCEQRLVGDRPRLSHSRSWPSTPTAPRRRAARTAGSARRPSPRRSGRRDRPAPWTPFTKLHHGGDRRVEDEATADVVGDLGDRLVRLARERYRRRGRGRLPRPPRARPATAA